MNENVKTPVAATPVGVAAALKARYGAGESDFAIRTNETIEVLLSHRSVRAYLPDALPAGTLEAIIAAAQSASTSSNVQAWSVVAVTDAGLKAELAKVAGGQKHMEECPVLLVWIADLARTKMMGARHDYPTEATPYLESYTVAVVDAALAAQNAVVAAESFGLGTVYIGAMRNNPERVAELLKLPPNAFGCFGLCVGFPDPARPFNVKPRLPQRVILHREHYDASLPQEAVDAYDATLAAFQATENLAPTGWTKAMKSRWRDAGSIKGREKLRGALIALGFKLD